MICTYSSFCSSLHRYIVTNSFICCFGRGVPRGLSYIFGCILYGILYSYRIGFTLIHGWGISLSSLLNRCLGSLGLSTSSESQNSHCCEYKN